MSDRKLLLQSLSGKLRSKLARAIASSPESAREVIEFVDDATQNDVIAPDVNEIIQRVIGVSELRVKNVMIPRALMVTIDIDSSVDEVLKIVTESGHSRFPVLGGHSDNEQQGVLLAKDLLQYIQDVSIQEFSLHDNLRDAMLVPEAMRLNTLLKLFQSTRNHMAIVVNEYNGIAGLITIEDVIEEIVGEIEDESDYDESERITKIADNQYMVHAQTEISDFNETFNVNIDEDTDTIGGVMLKLAGKVPDEGDVFDYEGLQFTIVSADQRKILSLRVTPKNSDR
ncbi:MAG: CBS domain-containing protein [Acidiferrobacterales bacterium]|nr:CBS domain-containing protein [Acidiferrobacterales bacterium]